MTCIRSERDMFQLGSCYLKIVVLLFSWKAWKFRTYYTIMALFQSVTSLGSMLWYCPSMPWRRDTSPSRFFLVISRDPFFTIPAPWKCFTLEHTSFTVIYSCILTSYFFVFISFPLFTVFFFALPYLFESWTMTCASERTDQRGETDGRVFHADLLS